MFGERLKQLRDEAGVTQQALADMLNVVRPTVAGYETKNKEPDFDKIRILCNYFNVTSDYLLGLSDKKNGMTVQGLMSGDANHSKQKIDVPFRDRLNEILLETPIDELSRITQVPVAAIQSFLTTNGPDLDDLRLFSYNLHVSIDYLLGGSYYELSDDEEELIQYYRMINKSDKRILMGEAASMAKPYIQQQLYETDSNSINDLMVAESKPEYIKKNHTVVNDYEPTNKYNNRSN